MDGKPEIIPANNIKNFAPEDLMDVNADVYYDAFWTGDGNFWEGGFYLAKILRSAGE